MAPPQGPAPKPGAPAVPPPVTPAAPVGQQAEDNLAGLRKTILEIAKKIPNEKVKVRCDGASLRRTDRAPECRTLSRKVPIRSLRRTLRRPRCVDGLACPCRSRDRVHVVAQKGVETVKDVFGEAKNLFQKK